VNREKAQEIVNREAADSKWAEVYRNQTDALEKKDIVIEQYKAMLRIIRQHVRRCDWECATDHMTDAQRAMIEEATQ
jgi:hypothetical protein